MRKNKVLFILFFILLIAGLLRFNKIDSFPPGLYMDEVSIGNNAYSIFTDGKDEHGMTYPIFFQAFGEFKLPIYIYLTSGSIAIFGKNDFAVRFPSAFFGTLTILIIYLLIKKLFNIRVTSQKFRVHNPDYFALLAGFLVTISPWHIHFSRGGFEAVVAVFFFLSGCLLLAYFWDKKKIYYLFAACLAFTLSTYTYSTFRLLSPIVWVGVSIFFLRKLPNKSMLIICGLLLFIVLSLPIIQFTFTQGGTIRFNETSSFSEYPTKNIFEKAAIYPMVYVKNYLSFFSTEFLFINGDGNGRHQIPGMGLFFKWEIIFLIIGVIWLIRQPKSVFKFVMFGILFISPIIPAVARPSPHSLRALLMFFPLTIFITCGLWYCLGSIKKFSKVFTFVIIFAVVIELFFYLHLYYFHYPNVNALDWGSGYKQTSIKADLYKDQFDKIVIDKNMLFANIYFQFYTPNLALQYGIETSEKSKDSKEKILLIKQIDSKHTTRAQLIDQVYLPGPKKDVFSQFWKL